MFDTRRREFIIIKRRDFIMVIASVAAWPLVAHSQPSATPRLSGNTSEKRNITSLTDSELKFNRPFVKDVTLEVVFKRAE